MASVVFRKVRSVGGAVFLFSEADETDLLLSKSKGETPRRRASTTAALLCRPRRLSRLRAKFPVGGHHLTPRSINGGKNAPEIVRRQTLPARLLR